MGGVRNLNFYSDFPIDFPSTLDLYRSGAGDTTLVWHDDAHHADSINVIDTGRDVCRSVTIYGTVPGVPFQGFQTCLYQDTTLGISRQEKIVEIACF